MTYNCSATFIPLAIIPILPFLANWVLVGFSNRCGFSNDDEWWWAWGYCVMGRWSDGAMLDWTSKTLCGSAWGWRLPICCCRFQSGHGCWLLPMSAYLCNFNVAYFVMVIMDDLVDKIMVEYSLSTNNSRLLKLYCNCHIYNLKQQKGNIIDYEHVALQFGERWWTKVGSNLLN